jgi:hypothetical protein
MFDEFSAGSVPTREEDDKYTGRVVHTLDLIPDYLAVNNSC